MIAMEIGLSLSGVGGIDHGVGSVAEAFDRLADAQDRVLANASRLSQLVPAISEARVQRIERVAEAYERMAAAAPGASSVQIASPSQAAAVSPSAGAGSVASTQSSATPSSSAGTRYIQGPNQRLAKIQEQMAIAEAEGDQAALADLTIAKARALRAKHAGEKLVNRGQEGTTADGLLDIVGDIRKAVQAGLSGDAFGLVSSAVKGISFLQERPGGLNIEQMLGNARGTRMIGGPATATASASPSGGGTLPAMTLHAATVHLHGLRLGGTGGGPAARAVFDPNQRGAFSAEALRRAHHTIAARNGVGQLAQAAGAAGRAAAGASGVGGALAGMGSVAAVAGPIAVAVGATVGALAIFTSAVTAAADSLSAIRRAEITSGGDSKDFGRLQALGLSPSQASTLAASVRNTAASDPWGQSASVSLGLPVPFDGSIQAMNEPAFLLAVIEQMAAMEKEGSRLLIATRLQSKELAILSDLYRRHSDTILSDAAAMNSVSEAYGKDAAEFEYQMGRLGHGWQALSDAFSGAFLDDLSPIVDLAADALHGLAGWISENEMAVEGLVGSLVPFLGHLSSFGKMLGTFPELFGRIVEVGALLMDSIKHPDHAFKNNEKAMELLTKPLRSDNGNDKVAEELRKNTEAVRKNTDALGVGVHGGGERVRGAMPSHLSGEALRQRLREQEIILGAFR